MSGFDINQLTITGNLTRDPELRSTTSGDSVCSIRIAHNDRRKVNGEWTTVPQYFDVTIWKGMGEYVARELAKGDKVVIAGRLKWREFEDKDGNKRQAVDITADSVVPVPKNGTAPPPADVESADDDDIPF